MKLRAIVDMSLRKSAEETIKDKDGNVVPNPEWDEWYEWKAGDVFEAPPNLKVKLALQRGIAEEVKPKKGAADG